MSDFDLVDYARRRLGVIQSRHNFNPKIGARQVRDAPAEIARVFGQFQQILALVDRFNLPVAIPYDASGRTPLERREARSKVPVCVYFGRKGGTSFWKIGSSIHSHARLRQVALGNDAPLSLDYVVEGVDGRDVEGRLHRHLRRYKTRDRNDPRKGEWFDLDAAYVGEVVRHLRAGVAPEAIPLPSRRIA